MMLHCPSCRCAPLGCPHVAHCFSNLEDKMASWFSRSLIGRKQGFWLNNYSGRRMLRFPLWQCSICLGLVFLFWVWFTCRLRRKKSCKVPKSREKSQKDGKNRGLLFCRITRKCASQRGTTMCWVSSADGTVGYRLNRSTVIFRILPETLLTKIL